MLPLHNRTWIFVLALIVAGCDTQVAYEDSADASGHTVPTPAVAAATAAVRQQLPFADQSDFDDAHRGLIASIPDLKIQKASGETIWNLQDYAFIDESAAKQGLSPASINPSLYRQSALNVIHGLFKVADGIYQLRGFDLANMSLIEGKTGWIVVDPLTSAETAKAAFAFASEHLGKKPVRAIIFTHSHIDHFGGALGILDSLPEEERKALRILAPEGFMEEATSENIIAGPAMGRRSMFMYGKNLARSERGHIGSGLGIGPAYGAFGIAEPTELIGSTPTTLDIDGMPFVFQYTPNTEAPAEMTFYLPQHKAFCGAELVSRTLHNLYTLRGAKVRDALGWSGLINEARELFGDSEVYFGSHHWPLWGQGRIQEFLVKQRDLYKYIHDQSVRLMNAGYTPAEIAEEIKLPASLSQYFSNRDYYGTVKHNAKAIYQAYLGWYTGNPAQLDPLPEVESAKRTIALMGGADKVLAHARQQFDALSQKHESVQPEYRWLAQLLNQVVFAEPDSNEAKVLLAKVYDQLGYLAESAPWRDVYLTGAYELRHGAPEQGIPQSLMKNVFLHTPVARFFDAMAVNLNGPKAEGETSRVKVHFTDLGETYLLHLENAVLHHAPAQDGTAADITLHITRTLFVDILVGEAGLKETLFGDQLKVEGSAVDLLAFLSLFDKAEGRFNIVEP